MTGNASFSDRITQILTGNTELVGGRFRMYPGGGHGVVFGNPDVMRMSNFSLVTGREIGSNRENPDAPVMGFDNMAKDLFVYNYMEQNIYEEKGTGKLFFIIGDELVPVEERERAVKMVAEYWDTNISGEWDRQEALAKSKSESDNAKDYSVEDFGYEEVVENVVPGDKESTEGVNDNSPTDTEEDDEHDTSDEELDESEEDDSEKNADEEEVDDDYKYQVPSPRDDETECKIPLLSKDAEVRYPSSQEKFESQVLRAPLLQDILTNHLKGMLGYDLDEERWEIYKQAVKEDYECETEEEVLSMLCLLYSNGIINTFNTPYLNAIRKNHFGFKDVLVPQDGIFVNTDEDGDLVKDLKEMREFNEESTAKVMEMYKEMKDKAKEQDTPAIRVKIVEEPQDGDKAPKTNPELFAQFDAYIHGDKSKSKPQVPRKKEEPKPYDWMSHGDNSDDDEEDEEITVNRDDDDDDTDVEIDDDRYMKNDANYYDYSDPNNKIEDITPFKELSKNEQRAINSLREKLAKAGWIPDNPDLRDDGSEDEEEDDYSSFNTDEDDESDLTSEEAAELDDMRMGRIPYKRKKGGLPPRLDPVAIANHVIDPENLAWFDAVAGLNEDNPKGMNIKAFYMGELLVSSKGSIPAPWLEAFADEYYERVEHCERVLVKRGIWEEVKTFIDYVMQECYPEDEDDNDKISKKKARAKVESVERKYEKFARAGKKFAAALLTNTKRNKPLTDLPFVATPRESTLAELGVPPRPRDEAFEVEEGSAVGKGGYDSLVHMLRSLRLKRDRMVSRGRGHTNKCITINETIHRLEREIFRYQMNVKDLKEDDPNLQEKLDEYYATAIGEKRGFFSRVYRSLKRKIINPVVKGVKKFFKKHGSDLVKGTVAVLCIFAALVRGNTPDAATAAAAKGKI